MKKQQLTGASMRQSQTMPQLSYTREDIQEQYLTRRPSTSKRARAQSSDPRCRYKQRRAELSSGSELDDTENELSGFETRNEAGGSRRSNRKRRRRANSASHLFSGCFSLPHLSSIKLHHGSSQHQNQHQQHQQQRRSILAHLGLVSSSASASAGAPSGLPTTTQSHSLGQASLPASQTTANLQCLTQAARKHVSFGSAQSPVQAAPQQPASSTTSHQPESVSMSQQSSKIHPLPITQQPNPHKSKPVILRNYEPRQAASVLESAGHKQRLPQLPQQSPPIYLVSQVPNISAMPAPHPRPPHHQSSFGAPLAGQLQQQSPRALFRRPAVPVRTQATQTEITAYHLMASPPLSSSASSSATRMITAVEAARPSLGTPENELPQIEPSHCSSEAPLDSEWSASGEHGEPLPGSCDRNPGASQQQQHQKVPLDSDAGSSSAPVNQRQQQMLEHGQHPATDASLASTRTESDASASIMMRDSDQPPAPEVSGLCTGFEGSCQPGQQPLDMNQQLDAEGDAGSQQHLEQAAPTSAANLDPLVNELSIDNELPYIEPPSQFKEASLERDATEDEDSDGAPTLEPDEAPRSASPELMSYSEASSQTDSAGPLMLRQMGAEPVTKPVGQRRDDFLTLELEADSLRPAQSPATDQGPVGDNEQSLLLLEGLERLDDEASTLGMLRLETNNNSSSSNNNNNNRERPSTSSTLSTRHHSYCSSDDFQQPKSLDVADSSATYAALEPDNRSASIEGPEEVDCSSGGGSGWSAGCGPQSHNNQVEVVEGAHRGASHEEQPVAADASSAQEAPLEREEEEHELDGIDLGQEAGPASLSIGCAQAQPVAPAVAANGSAQGEGGATIKLDCVGFMMAAGGHKGDVLPAAPTYSVGPSTSGATTNATSRELGDNHERAEAAAALAHRIHLFRAPSDSSSCSVDDSRTLAGSSDSAQDSFGGGEPPQEEPPRPMGEPDEDKWPLCDLESSSSGAASGPPKSNNSTPTTVSELECDEELSTPSFVDTYRSKLAQMRQLADSVLDQVLAELLVEPRASGSGPAATSQVEPGSSVMVGASNVAAAALETKGCSSPVLSHPRETSSSTTTTTAAAKPSAGARRPQPPKKPAHLRQKQEVAGKPVEQSSVEQLEAANAALAVTTTSLATAAAAAAALALQSVDEATTEPGNHEEATRTLARQSEAHLLPALATEAGAPGSPEVAQVAARAPLAAASALAVAATGQQPMQTRRRSSLELSTVSEEPSEELNDDDDELVAPTNCRQPQQQQPQEKLPLFAAENTNGEGISSEATVPHLEPAADLGPHDTHTLLPAGNLVTEPPQLASSSSLPLESPSVSLENVNSISVGSVSGTVSQQQHQEATLPEELDSTKLAELPAGRASSGQQRRHHSPSSSTTSSSSTTTTTTTRTGSPPVSAAPLPPSQSAPLPSPSPATAASSSECKTRQLMHDDTLETLEADPEVEGLLDGPLTTTPATTAELVAPLEEGRDNVVADIEPPPNFSTGHESSSLIDFREASQPLQEVGGHSRNESKQVPTGSCINNPEELEGQDEMEDIEEESSVSVSQQGVLVTTDTTSSRHHSHNSQQQQQQTNSASTPKRNSNSSTSTPVASPHRKPAPIKTGSSESATAAILEHLSKHHDRTELHLDEPAPALEPAHSLADCHREHTQREPISEQKSNSSSRSSAGSTQMDNNASGSTATIKRNSQARVQQHPLASSTTTAATSQDSSTNNHQPSMNEQAALNSSNQQRRGPPLGKLKSANAPAMQQHGNIESVEGSICSSCSCMEQDMNGAVQRAGSTWMSQEEGTVFTENYWMSHWLYISEHEESKAWRCNIEASSRQDESGAEQEASTGTDAMLECMPEVSCTSSEKDFSDKYKSTTRKMIHRRAAIEMYKRIANNNLRREKRVEINRSKGEFGFRIHGSRPVVVSAIERGTSAEHCGLLVGDLIYAINGTNILDMAHSDVVRLAHSVDSSSLILDLVPTSDFLKTNKYSRASNRRYEPTLTGHLMRLSPSTAQPLLVDLQEQMAHGPQVSPQRRAARLNEVMRLAWRRRFFVLRSDNCLYWYKTAQDIEPCGGINLQGFSAALTNEFREPSYVIRMVKYGSQPHYLGTDSMCDIQVWIDAINKAATEANQNDPYMRRTLKLARTKPNLIPEPDCAGYLYKYSQKRGGGAHWRPAYFVLKDACLYLFREQQAELVEQASAVYYLHGYKVCHRHIEQKKHTFELISPRETVRPMFLMASSEIDCRRWIAALEYSIERWIEIG